MDNVFEAEALKLIAIIDTLERNLASEPDTLSAVERSFRLQVIRDLQIAWASAVLEWRKHGMCR